MSPRNNNVAAYRSLILSFIHFPHSPACALVRSWVSPSIRWLFCAFVCSRVQTIPSARCGWLQMLNVTGNMDLEDADKDGSIDPNAVDKDFLEMQNAIMRQVGRLAGWLAGWLVGWLVVLVGWLVCTVPCCSVIPWWAKNSAWRCAPPELAAAGAGAAVAGSCDAITPRVWGASINCPPPHPRDAHPTA